MRFLPFVLLLAACGTEPASETPPAPTQPGHEHTTDHHASATPLGDHGHAARHGGIQRELDGMHVEALLQPDGVRFYLTDADNHPVALEGWAGTAVVSGPSGVVTVDLVSMGEHLHAPATLVEGKPASVVLTLTRDGKAQSASFDTQAVGTGYHDHTSLHGGVVGMWAHYHVELVARDDRYEVWLSDASRSPATGAASGFIVDGSQRIPLTPDPGTGALVATLEGAGSRPVTVEITHGGQTFSLPFEVAQEGASGDGHEHHGH